MRSTWTRSRPICGSTTCSPATAPTASAASRPRSAPASNTMTTWAVIVAAGSGDRLATDRPKAFARLGDRPLLAESLERLDRSDWIDGIVVVCPEGWEEPAILLAEELGASKVAQAVTGGASRAESVRLGVNEV